MATAIATQQIGKVVQVIGPVLDVEFESGHLPELYNALELTVRDAEGEHKVVVEVQQHIGRNQVRAVAMSSSDGVERGFEVVDTGSSITVPVGEAALGRILNVLRRTYNRARQAQITQEIAEIVGGAAALQG